MASLQSQITKNADDIASNSLEIEDVRETVTAMSTARVYTLPVASGWQVSRSRGEIRGNVVSLNFRLLNTGTFGTNVDMSSLPANMIPPETLVFGASSTTAAGAIGAAYISVHDDGAVRASTSLASARWIIGTCTYLVD